MIEVFVARIEEGEEGTGASPRSARVPPSASTTWACSTGRGDGGRAGPATGCSAEPGDLRPGLLAACVVSIQRVVVDAIVAGDDRPVADLVREAIDLLAKGFDQLGSG